MVRAGNGIQQDEELQIPLYFDHDYHVMQIKSRDELQNTKTYHLLRIAF